MASASYSTNHLQRGYVSFSGNAEDFHGWVSLSRSLMYETGLGKVMSGAKTAPAITGSGADATARAEYRTNLAKINGKNGKLYTRLLLATSDFPEGYSSPASQVV